MYSRLAHLIVVAVVTGVLLMTMPAYGLTQSTDAPTASSQPIAVPSIAATRPGSTIPAPTPIRSPLAAMIRVGRIPWRMAVGGGFLWVLNLADRTVSRIDPRTNQVVGEPIPAGVSPGAIAFGDNALWVATIGDGDLSVPNEIDAVSKIDPESGETLATIKVSRGPENLAVGGGIVWVVNFGVNADTVSRIDPKTNQIIGKPIVTGDGPISIAIGDGSAWVANHDADTITRIDLATNQVVANIPVPFEPHRVAYGEGAVWVADWHHKAVSRIDPKTNQVVAETIPIGFTAGSIAVGHGSVWVTSDYRGRDNQPEDVVLVRIDVQTNRAVETIPVGGSPIDVAVTEDAVWVSIQGPDMVVRINP
jgi:YVTN family beta-propeller protein